MGRAGILSDAVALTENSGHHGEQHTDGANPDGECPGAFSGAIEPIGVIEHNPEPGRDHPRPLANPLRHGHQSRAFVIVVTHLITHRNVRDAENG